MRDAITRTRMQRIDSLFAALPRMVRDLSAELGKQVALEVDGGDVELDREMIEMIRDPLTHIVRNAIDHGIETADERAAAGKPRERARSRVSARQAGNQILIEVADDGRGIDGDTLVTQGDRGRPASAASRPSGCPPAQKTALIFEPGLSTAERGDRHFRPRRRHGRGPRQYRADRRRRRHRQQAGAGRSAHASACR